jgi:flagellar FliL protein
MAEETTQATEATEAPKKGKLPLIGGIVAGLALGIGAGFFVLGPKLAPSPAHAAEAKAAKSEGHGEGKEGEKKEGDAAPVYQLDNMVLNLSGSNGQRLLLMTVALQVKDEATLNMVKGHDAEMRDMVLQMFGAKTADQVVDVTARGGFRKDLIAALDKIFPAGTVKKVYFPQFVIQ